MRPTRLVPVFTNDEGPQRVLASKDFQPLARMFWGQVEPAPQVFFIVCERHKADVIRRVTLSGDPAKPVSPLTGQALLTAVAIRRPVNRLRRGRAGDFSGGRGSIRQGMHFLTLHQKAVLQIRRLQFDHVGLGQEGVAVPLGSRVD